MLRTAIFFEILRDRELRSVALGFLVVSAILLAVAWRGSGGVNRALRVGIVLLLIVGVAYVLSQFIICAGCGEYVN